MCKDMVKTIINESDVVTFMMCLIIIQSQDMSHGVERGMS